MSYLVNKKRLISMIFIFAVCLPSPIRSYLGVTLLINIIGYVGFLFGIWVELSFKLYNKKIWLPIHIWMIWIILTDLLNGNSVIDAIRFVYPIFVLFTSLCYMGMERLDRLVVYLSRFLSLGLIANLITYFMGGLFRENTYEMAYYFGIRVNINDVWIFSLLLITICMAKEGWFDKILGIAGIACGLTFIILKWVSTAIMTTAIFVIVLCYFALRHHSPQRKNIFKFFMFVLLGFTVAFTMFPNVERFGWIIEDILGESLTMDGRTLIWASCLSQIHGIHWLIGNGYGHSYVFALENGNAVTHPHNQYLAILFDFGIIGVIVFIKMIYDEIKLYYSLEGDRIQMIIGAGIPAMIVMGICATYLTKVYWLLWYIVCVLYTEQKRYEGWCENEGTEFAD